MRLLSVYDGKDNAPIALLDVFSHAKRVNPMAINELKNVKEKSIQETFIKNSIINIVKKSDSGIIDLTHGLIAIKDDLDKETYDSILRILLKYAE